MTENLEYGYKKNSGRHIWYVRGDKGAIHIWCDRHHPEHIARFGDVYYGGIELHQRSPMYQGQKPVHNCWLIGGDCYTDGSGLQFDEKIAPYLPRDEDRMDPENPLIQSELFHWYQSKFGDSDD